MIYDKYQRELSTNYSKQQKLKTEAKNKTGSISKRSKTKVFIESRIQYGMWYCKRSDQSKHRRWYVARVGLEYQRPGQITKIWQN